jgi:hypothetical protein
MRNKRILNPHQTADIPSFTGLCELEPRTLMSASPIAHNDTHTALNTGVPIVIAVLANDTDPDGDALDPDSVVVTAGNAYGTLEIDYLHGTLIYTPDAGFLGTETFSYMVADMNGDYSNEATVTLHIVNVLPDPTPGPDPQPEPVPDTKDDLVFLAPTSHDLAKLTLRRSGDMLQVVNNRTGEVLLTHALDDINSLAISIEGRRAIQLTIDFASGGAFDLPAGVVVNGGNHRCEDDAITLVGTAGNDALVVDGSNLSFNGLNIAASGIERLDVRNGAGNDSVMLTGVIGFEQVNIDDASGNDVYVLAAAAGRQSCNRVVVHITDRAGDDSYQLSAGKYDITDKVGKNAFDYSGNPTHSQPFAKRLAHLKHMLECSIRFKALFSFRR